jgi:1-phosphofructokinase family hexose kinase
VAKPGRVGLTMLIASPNLTTDRILTIDELRPGEVLRFDSARISPGGKGVNVLRAARTMGFAARLVAFSPGRTGRAVVDLISDEGLDLVPVPAGGEVRAASIVLERGGRVTVLNEPGPRISTAQWEAYERTIEANLGDHPFLVCIGSAPPGTPPEGYARLARMARESGARVLVDAAGPLLEAALDAGPDIVTPNLVEAEAVLLGSGAQPVEERSPGVRDRALQAAAALVARGCATAVVTAGRAGAAVAMAADRRWWEAPRAEVRNPIGAGDALVAALVGSLERGRNLDGAVLMGLASAAASVETEVPGVVERRRVLSLLSLLERLESA